MKFKKNISRVLACSLLLSMYNCCVVNGMEQNKQDLQNNENKENLQTAFVVYNPDQYNIDKQTVPEPYNPNKLPKNVNSHSCYICEAKDNPFINHVLGKEREKMDEDSVIQCIKCGKVMHKTCWEEFSKKSANEYEGQLPPNMIKALSSGCWKLCPSCAYINEQKNRKRLNKKEEQKGVVKRNETRESDSSMGIDRKYLLLFAAVVVSPLLKDNKVVVNVNR